MNTDREEAIGPEAQLTQKILAAAFKVLNALGCGFLEKVYENALLLELRRSGIRTEQQKGFHVLYDGAIVGEYQADLVVDGRVIVECKAASTLDSIHEAQLLNYLKAVGIRVGLLLNFGRPRLQYRRFIA